MKVLTGRVLSHIALCKANTVVQKLAKTQEGIKIGILNTNTQNIWMLILTIVVPRYCLGALGNSMFLVNPRLILHKHMCIVLIRWKSMFCHVNILGV